MSEPTGSNTLAVTPLSHLLRFPAPGDDNLLQFLFQQLPKSEYLRTLSRQDIKALLIDCIELISSQDHCRHICALIYGLTQLRYQLNIESDNQLKEMLNIIYIELVETAQQNNVGSSIVQTVADTLIRMLQDWRFLLEIFIRFDARLTEINLLARMFNLLLQQYLASGSQLIGDQLVKTVVTLGQLSFKEFDVTALNYSPTEFRIKRDALSFIDAFNKKPVKGIQALRQAIPNIQHIHIAVILRQHAQSNMKIKSVPSFEKQRIGEYLGADNPLSKQVCQAFMRLDKLEGLHLDDCLRVTLNRLRLPKEPQGVGRILQQLTNIVLPHSGLKSTDDLYVYLYLIMMVQTNRNPNVPEKDKHTIQSFLKLSNDLEKQHGGIDPERRTQDFLRISKNPLENIKKYDRNSIFTEKHATNVPVPPIVPAKLSPIDSNAILTYLFEFFEKAFIQGNQTAGIFQAALAYGRAGAPQEQRIFMEELYRHFNSGTAEDSYCTGKLLQMALKEGNSVLEQNWLLIAKMAFCYQDEGGVQQHHIVDQLFVTTGQLNPRRLINFIVCLCQLSTSDVKTDRRYTRQLFVLRHIAEIVQYNTDRIASIWEAMWQPISEFFRTICLHPRAQISLSAIDSYKQLTLKILKFTTEADERNHSAILETYLFIFRRGNLNQRDMVLRVLMNVISSDLRSGWEFLYEILELSSDQDKNILVTIIDRLLTQVGLAKLTSLLTLHQILLRQLKICGSTLRRQLIQIVWTVSCHIASSAIWKDVLQAARDTYKNNKDRETLALFSHACCQILRSSVQDGSSNISLADQINEKDVNSTEDTNIQQQLTNRTRKHSFDSLSPSQLDSDPNFLVYSQLATLIVFASDQLPIQSNRNRTNSILIVTQVMSLFHSLPVQFIVEHLGRPDGKFGILSLWGILLASNSHHVCAGMCIKQIIIEVQFGSSSGYELKVSICKFASCPIFIDQYYYNQIIVLYLHIYLPQAIIPFFCTSQNHLTYQSQLHSLTLWCLNHYQCLKRGSFPLTILQLKQLDNDLLPDLVQAITLQSPTSPKLIQCSLSSDSQMDKIVGIIVDNYKVLREINRSLYLRAFLWGNSFITDSHLPGYLLHEFLTIKLLLSHLPFLRNQKQQDNSSVRPQLNRSRHKFIEQTRRKLALQFFKDINERWNLMKMIKTGETNVINHNSSSASSNSNPIILNPPASTSTPPTTTNPKSTIPQPKKNLQQLNKIFHQQLQNWLNGAQHIVPMICQIIKISFESQSGRKSSKESQSEINSNKHNQTKQPQQPFDSNILNPQQYYQWDFFIVCQSLCQHTLSQDSIRSIAGLMVSLLGTVVE